MAAFKSEVRHMDKTLLEKGEHEKRIKKPVACHFFIMSHTIKYLAAECWRNQIQKIHENMEKISQKNIQNIP